ncbi:MAG: beta-ureidopropionase [Armatimonadetes bacterium]|nr:beta-ureidopropionase [Armatimonadota bacterium]
MVSVTANVAAAQIKPRKGDYVANLARIGELFTQLEGDAPPPDVLVLPETALTGYFLEGGVRDVARTAAEVFRDLQSAYQSSVVRPDAMLDVVIGFYEVDAGIYYNSAISATLAADPTSARVNHLHRKFFLPTYGVFDEKRFVARGHQLDAFSTRFGPAAVLICEDVWHSVTPAVIALKGAEALYVISASPARDFSGDGIGSVSRWTNTILPGIAMEHGIWVVHCGLVGFEGGKGFGGSSQIIDPWGKTVVVGPLDEECIIRASINFDDVAIARAASPLLPDLREAIGDLTAELTAAARCGLPESG